MYDAIARLTFHLSCLRNLQALRMIDEAKVAAEEKQRRREEEVGWSQGVWGNVWVIKGCDLEKFNIYTTWLFFWYIKGMKNYTQFSYIGILSKTIAWIGVWGMLELMGGIKVDAWFVAG